MLKQKAIFKFQIISALFAIILGTLLHFTYEWSNNNPLVGIFSAVNESTWEHLKILFVPMLITLIIGSFYLKDTKNYLCAKSKGIFLAMAFIVIFYYTYTGIIGKNFGFLNISSFIFAIILGEFYTYKKLNENTLCNKKVYIATLMLLSLGFIIFTFKTPHIGIFKDPSTNNYGIKEKM